MAALFVADVKGFSAGIAYGIVVPRREAEFMGILAPCVGAAALGDDGSEKRICQHVHPRRGRHLPVCGRNYILPPIRGEPSHSVEENQIAARQRGAGGGSAAADSGRRKMRDWHFRRGATVDLVRERSLAVGDDDTRDRLEQNAVLARYLLCGPYKDASRPVCSRWLQCLRQSAP